MRMTNAVEIVKYWAHLSRTLVCACMISASAGCGAGSGEPGHGAPDAGPTGGPLYVVSTRVTTADGAWAGYLATTPSLEGTFDIDDAIETSVGTIYAEPETGFLFHASADEPTITRWNVNEDGSLTRGPVVSFANLGVTALDGALDAANPFYAEDKAYFTAFGEAPEVVIWNPREMSIIGTIPIDVEPRGALIPTLSYFQRDDRLFVTVFWQEDFSSGDWSNFGDEAELIEIDPATDTVVNVTTEPRCNVLDRVSRSPDGTAYFSPRGFWTPIRALLGGERGVDPCAVRVVASGRTFDEGYDLDLKSLVGGRFAGDFNLLDERTALISVWHPELVSPLEEDRSNWTDVAFENGHLWWRWTIGEAQAVQIPDQRAGAYGGVMLEVDGRKLVMQAEGDFSATTLFDVDADGALRPVLTGPGYIWGVARVR